MKVGGSQGGIFNLGSLQEARFCLGQATSCHMSTVWHQDSEAVREQLLKNIYKLDTLFGIGATAVNSK